MEHQQTNFFLAPDPQPFPSSSIDLSPLKFILAVLALVTIPALIYTFFFSLKCPPSNPFNRNRRRTVQNPDHTALPAGTTPTSRDNTNTNKEEAASDLKNNKDSQASETGSKCTVCLSVLVDGVEKKQLSACRHSFHAKCIDKWLRSQSTCPVCRAPVKPPSRGDRRRASVADADLRQGLPDASTLV